MQCGFADREMGRERGTRGCGHKDGRVEEWGRTRVAWISVDHDRAMVDIAG